MRWSGEKLLQPEPPRNGADVRVCAFRIVSDFVLFSLHRTDRGALEFPRCAPSKAREVIGVELHPQFVGALDHRGTTYVWYECRTSESSPALFLTKAERRWWTLSSEIVNWQKVLHFPVADAVTSLFMAHSELLFVENAEGDKYECPLVGYYGAYYTKILKLAIIGAPRSDWEMASMGPHFYFGDYAGGMKYAFAPMALEKEMYHAGEKVVRDDGLFTRGGIARFALRTGDAHTMMLGGRPDRSRQTRKGIREGKVRLEDAPFRDPDGVWAKTFDAALLGRRTVTSRSTGKPKVLHPQYVVKKFHQHVPLSYHYVDTASQDAANAVIE